MWSQIMNQKKLLTESEKGTILHLIVKPNSRKQALLFDPITDTITVCVKSPPEKGKANKELLKFLAKYLEKSSSEMQIVTGHTSRDKAILILNTDITTIRNKIEK